MYWLRVTALLLIAALLQTTIVPAVAVRGVRPDLPLVLAACIAVRERARAGWPWRAFWVGWAAGLVVDLYSAGSHVPFGLTALVFGVVAMGLSKMGEQIFVDSSIAQVVILAPVCVAGHCLLALGASLLGGRPPGGTLGQAAWTGLYSALIAPLVFAAVRPLGRYFGPRPRRDFGRA